MKVEGVKITWIAADEEPEHRERAGFSDVCRYGSTAPERNEVGCICEAAGEPEFTGIVGIWSTPVRVTERIFVVDPT